MDLTSASKVILRSNISAAQVDENYSNYNDTVSVKGTAGMMEYIIRALVGKKEEDHNENKESQQNVEESKETIAIANDLKSTAAEFFAKVDSIFSEHIPDSEISRINSSKSLEEIFTLSQPLGAVLSFALKVSQKTRGLFDPAVGPLCKHLKEQLGDNDASSSATATPPPPTVFKNAFVLRQTGNGYTLQKLHPLSKITLCGISKGWAVDELSAIVMEKFKLKGVFVSWAGDIRVRGLLYQGAPNRKWPVTVHEPTATSTEENLESQPIITTILLQAPSNKAQSSPSAIATSGNQFQGEHIYNPATGSSKTTVHQSTIVAQSCMIADALAKVGIVSQTIPAARRLLESLRNDPVVCVEDFILYTAPSAATSGIPLITRMQIPGIELPEHREIRKTKHNNGAHVIVVGAGLAGLSAAVEAAEWGANVTIIEKESRVGGNSAKATSGINAWGTPAQVNNSILDDERYFERDTFLSGKGGHCDHSLVRTLSTQSANAVKWLSTKFDIDLSVVSQLGGHSQPRTHRIPAKSDGKPVPVGYTIISHIKAYIDAHLSDKIKILTSCSVKELILTPESKMTRARRSISPALVSKKSRPTSETKDEVQPYKEVIGVTYINNITGEEIELKADATVLCTGGFCADHTSDSLLNEFRPDLLKVPTTNGGFATGDGMKICRKIGASLLDMEKIQLHPTGFIDPNDPWNVTKYLAPEAIRGSGGILVNQNGKRFINELDLRSVVAAAIQNHCESYKSDVELPEDKAKNVLSEQKFAWCILSTEAQVKFGTPTLNFYKDSLKLIDGPFYSIAEVAKFIKVDEEVLLHTVKDYQLSAANGICATTKKTVFPAKFTLNADETYVVARVTPSLHYSMGGVEISPSGEVQERLSSSEQIFGRRRHIKRLLAAGEVTGGVHGENRLGGNSLLECVVFGRIAGERAATINTKEQNCLTLKGNDWNPCVLREMRITDDLYGLTTRTLRFNMHGMIQSSGLRVGQFLGVRGELDGETLVGWFSPITRPGDLGVVGILTRTDEKGGAISNLLTRLRPGSSCYLKIMGGLELDYIKEDIVSMICFNKGGRHVKRLGMLAGGTGIAPMVQLVRAYIRFVLDDVEETEREISLSSEGRRLLEQKSKAAASSATGDDEEGAASALVSLEEEEESTPPLNLIYAAETSPELAFVKIMTQIQEQHPDLFRFYIVLNQPPLGWTEGIGFITADIIKEHMFYPPKKDDLVVICGPPIFEQIMGKTLTDALKFERDAWYSFSQG